MSLNESIVEDAALEWFGELGGKRVKSEIGRVKSWSSFSISLFTLLQSGHSRGGAGVELRGNTDHLKCAWVCAQRNL